MKHQENDKLKSLFQEIKMDDPSKGFEDRLMQQIQVISDKQAKIRKSSNIIYTVLSIIGGIAAMIVIPIIIFYYTGWEVSFNVSTFNIKWPAIDPFIVLISASVLSLLIADTLIRKHIWNKKHKKLD